MMPDKATTLHAVNLAKVFERDFSPADAPRVRSRYKPTFRLRPDLREALIDVIPYPIAYGEAAAKDDAHSTLEHVAHGGADTLDGPHPADDIAPDIAGVASTYDADALHWLTEDGGAVAAVNLLHEAGITHHDPVHLAVTARYLAALQHVHVTLHNLIDVAEQHLEEYTDAVDEAARETIYKEGHKLSALDDTAVDALTDAITADEARPDLARVAAHRDAQDVGRSIALTYARAALHHPDRPRGPEAQHATKKATQ